MQVVVSLALLMLFAFELLLTAMSNGGAYYNDEDTDGDGGRGYGDSGRGRRGYAGPGRGYGGGYNDGFVKEESGGGYGVDQRMPPPQGRG
jgi:hypothetical protein